MKGGESKSEEVFEEKDNQELEEQEEGEDNCPRVGTHQRQLEFRHRRRGFGGPSLDNRLGAVQQNKISP